MIFIAWFCLILYCLAAIVSTGYNVYKKQHPILIVINIILQALIASCLVTLVILL